MDQLGLDPLPTSVTHTPIHIYSKIKGKQMSHALVFLNQDVIHHFNWLADTIEASDGVHLLDVIEWGHSNTNLIIYCDASLPSLGFIVPSHKLGFTSVVPLYEFKACQELSTVTI